LTNLATIQFYMHQTRIGKLNVPNSCLFISFPVSEEYTNKRYSHTGTILPFHLYRIGMTYAQILKSGGAYKNSSEVTHRTIRANMISSAPWLVPFPTPCQVCHVNIKMCV
jgi:hypothetical protein